MQQQGPKDISEYKTEMAGLKFKFNRLGIIDYAKKLYDEGNFTEAFGLLDAFNKGKTSSYAQVSESDCGFNPSLRPTGTVSNQIKLFSDNDFTEGDLVYGLSGHRDVLIDRLTIPPPYVVVDDLNAHFLGVNTGQVYGTPNNPKQSSVGAADEFKQFLDTILSLKGKPLSSTLGGSKGDVETRLRRSSKIGVLFATAKGGKVHFNLDQVVPDSVVHKNYPGLDVEPTQFTSKQRSITGAELRFVRRNWEYLKDKVVFYRDRQEVPAPWVSDPELWKDYKPKGLLPSEVVVASHEHAERFIDSGRRMGNTTVSSKTLCRATDGTYLMMFRYTVHLQTGPIHSSIVSRFSEDGRLLHMSVEARRNDRVRKEEFDF